MPRPKNLGAPAPRFDDYQPGEPLRRNQHRLPLERSEFADVNLRQARLDREPLIAHRDRHETQHAHHRHERSEHQRRNERRRVLLSAVGFGERDVQRGASVAPVRGGGTIQQSSRKPAGWHPNLLTEFAA